MLHRILALAVIVTGLAAVPAFAQGPVYELRTYTAAPGKLKALMDRFEKDTIRIFDRLHMESVGYWIPEGDRSQDTLIYILKHPSRAEADKNWAAFAADPEWRKVAAESEKDGRLAIKVERVWLTPAAFSKLK